MEACGTESHCEMKRNGCVQYDMSYPCYYEYMHAQYLPCFSDGKLPFVYLPKTFYSNDKR